MGDDRFLLFVSPQRLPDIVRAIPRDALREIVHSEAEWYLCLERGAVGVAVVDAEMLAPQQREATLRRAVDDGWLVFIDCAMSNRSISALLSIANVGLAGVLLKSDGVETHAARFQDSAMSRIGVELLAAFAPNIARMAPQLAVAVLELCSGHQPIVSVTALVVRTGMSRRWVEMQLTYAGIGSARALVEAVLLARAHPLLLDRSLSLAIIAARARLGSARTAKTAIEVLVAAPVDAVRSGMPAREFVDRMRHALARETR